tara:strand:+ start:3281 stop:3997 length:717 start_codon:yes stop_codon:yes gene_type:complete
MSRNIIDVYDRSIFEMKNLFTPEECKEYIEYYEKRLHKFQGQTIDTLGKISVNTDFKDSLDAHLFGDGRAPNQPPIAQRLWNLYMDKLKICHSEYMKHVAPLDPTEPHGPFILKNFMHRGRSTTPQIQRTDKGCKGFAWHTDSSGCGGKETRNIAVIIYLNDIDEANGGSTEFNSGRKVQPEMGKALFFPASHLHIHRGNPILNGPSKYIITCFIEEWSRDSFQTDVRHLKGLVIKDP